MSALTQWSYLLNALQKKKKKSFGVYAGNGVDCELVCYSVRMCARVSLSATRFEFISCDPCRAEEQIPLANI